jgi:hypothetical protein
MPNESPEMLEEQLRLIPFISHLAPPSTLSKVRVDRYSPYFERPAEFGIELRGPEQKYWFVHPGRDVDRAALAYSFEHAETAQRADQESMLTLRRRLGARVGLWKKLHDQSRFSFRLGPGLTVLHDHRPHVSTGRKVLRGSAHELFRAFVHGARTTQAVAGVSERTGTPAPELRSTLRQWATCGWVYLEGLYGLVLAVHDSRRDEVGRAAALGGRSAR